MAVLQIFVYLVKAQSHMISSNPTQFEKDKYTDQIKVSIMFFGNSIRFLKLVGLIVNKQFGKNQYRKKEQNQHSSVFKVLR